MAAIFDGSGSYTAFGRGQTVSPSATVQAGVRCGFQCAEALFAARLGLCNIGSGDSPIFHLVSKLVSSSRRQNHEKTRNALCDAGFKWRR